MNIVQEIKLFNSKEKNHINIFQVDISDMGQKLGQYIGNI